MIEIDSPGLLLPGDFVVQTEVGFRAFCAQIVTSAYHDENSDGLVMTGETRRLQISHRELELRQRNRVTHDARTSVSTAWRS